MVKKSKKKRGKSWLVNLSIIVFSAGLFGSGVFLIWVANLKTPTLESFGDRRINQSTKIYDRTGEVLLYDVYEKTKRTVVPLEDISINIRNATVAIEDAEFYNHGGIKLSSIIRAFLSNLTKIGSGNFGWGQGGSTITQQVVKNSILTSEKKISRKIKEWILAVKLEKVYSKETILSYYLNENPYGGSIYGVEEASKTFFGKKAKDVTLAEAAYLAALPQAPTYYSPYGNHREELDRRKNLVLEKMRENHFISEEEYETALKEKVTFRKNESFGIKAPHFVIFVKEYLEKKFGETMVRNGGLKVITTLDYNIQKKAEEIVKQYALQNEKTFNAENAALVTINPKNGDILAMVGSRDYFDEKIDGNFNVALAHRQPGSAFKPFVYATAFNKGFLPETVVFDLETEFSAYCKPDGSPILPGNENLCYRPKNYDGIFRGPISLRDALAQSVNIPAVKTLYLAGLSDSLQTAKNMGISTLTEVNRYGLTLVLGGGEVSLLEMTSAYGVFATEGVRYPIRSIIAVETSDGKTIYKPEVVGSTVLKAETARKISDILSDEEARSPAFGRHSYLYFPDRPVAVKTGTTNDYRDAWIIGYTPSLAVGAWAGNNDNRPMEKKVAGFIVAPLWHAFMEEILKDYEVEFFNKPEVVDEKIKPIIRGKWQGNETYKIDRISGKLATAYTPPETVEEKSVVDIHSILHWVNKNDPLGAPPLNPENDPQYERWEYAVAKWSFLNGYQNNVQIKPTDFDDIHTPENSPIITILKPLSEQTISSSDDLTVVLNYSGKYPVGKIDVFINDFYVGTLRKEPFEIKISTNNLPNLKPENVLTISAYDSVFNRTTVSSNFSVR